MQPKLNTSISPPAPIFSEQNLPWGYRPTADLIAQDQRPFKLDLRVGSFFDQTGTAPVLESVLHAQELIKKTGAINQYLPPAGLSEFNTAIQDLVLGTELNQQLANRAVTFQTIGAAGALRVAADFLKQQHSSKNILLSDIGWADHQRIFSRAGLNASTYPYYNQEQHIINFDQVIASLNTRQAGDTVVLQAACHNPTGCDFSREQWLEIFSTLSNKKLLPVFDLSYPGFGTNLEQDFWPIRHCAQNGFDLLLACSWGKSFSMCNARVGTLTLVTSSPEVTKRATSQILAEIQANYSSPPSQGAEIMATILGSDLKDIWREELKTMRAVIETRRASLVSELSNLGALEPYQQIATQRGIFAWTGITRTQSKLLGSDFGLYIPSSGRLCLGALPDHRIPDVAQALSKIIQ